MAKANYKKLQKVANKLLDNSGQEVVISHTEEGEYDPETGLLPSVTTTQNAMGVLLDYGSKEIDGTVIQIQDKRFLLSAINSSGGQLTKPFINDTIIVDSVNYTIKEPLSEIKPSGTVAFLFKLNLRA